MRTVGVGFIGFLLLFWLAEPASSHNSPEKQLPSNSDRSTDSWNLHKTSPPPLQTKAHRSIDDDDHHHNSAAAAAATVVRDNDGVLHHGFLLGAGDGNPKRQHGKRSTDIISQADLHAAQAHWDRFEVGNARPGSRVPGADDPQACPKSIYPNSDKARVFLNVRYSRPFPPEPPAAFGWTKLKIDNSVSEEENKEWGHVCPQAVMNASQEYEYHGNPEDCLSLNIFSPIDEEKQQSPSNRSLYPVLFFVHGGAFMRGSAAELGSCGIVENLVHPHRIVVVTVQYRLGLWGWFDFDYQRADGDNDNVWGASRGFWDVVIALNWVHRNIARFGGDPHQVTLAGQEAGACLVGWLASFAMEPVGVTNTWLEDAFKFRNRGQPPTKLIDTFNNVIMQSGSTLYCVTRGINSDDPSYSVAHAQSNLFLCKSGEKRDECMFRLNFELDAKGLVNKQHKALDTMLYPMFQLSLGRGGLPDYRISRLFAKNSKKINFLMGITEHEWVYHDMVMKGVLGTEVYKNRINRLLKLARGESHYDPLHHIFTDFHNAFKDPIMVDAILAHYTNWTEEGEPYRTYIQFMTDVIFTVPMFFDANYFTKNGHTVYLYKFTHAPPRKLHDHGVVDVIRSHSDLPIRDAVPHRADLTYLFMPVDKWSALLGPTGAGPHQNEATMARAMGDTWAHFVRHGRPLPESHPFVSGKLNWSLRPFVRLGDGQATMVHPNDSLPWPQRLIAHGKVAGLWEDWRWDYVQREEEGAPECSVNLICVPPPPG